MNPLLLTLSIVASTLIFYLIFLFLGFGGINQNRIAQGLDKEEID